MNIKTFFGVRTLILALLLCTTFISFAQQPSQEEMMKAWTAYMTPGDMHAMLAKADGEWSTEMSMWMDPKAAPVKSNGTCTYKMILGGRYQQGEYKGDFMGMPMEGIATTGYDNAKKTFESTWVDNMGTGTMKATGTYDAASKTISLKGMAADPSSGKDVMMRQTVKFVDDKNHVMEMFMTPPGGGKEIKTMEIKYTKK